MESSAEEWGEERRVVEWSGREEKRWEEEMGEKGSCWVLVSSSLDPPRLLGRPGEEAAAVGRRLEVFPIMRS